jgi:hypothetical protein
MARKPNCYHGIDPEIWPSMDPSDKEKARWNCVCNRKRREEAKKRIKWWRKVYGGSPEFSQEELADLRESDPDEWSHQTGQDLMEVMGFEQEQADALFEQAEKDRYKALANNEKALRRLEFTRRVRGQYREDLPGREDSERREMLDREQFELYWIKIQEEASAQGDLLNPNNYKFSRANHEIDEQAKSDLILD